MSKRKDRVVLDVGGTRFASSISTLSANSAYFAALFSRWDAEGYDDDEEVFLDLDPDVFRVLLSCMRHKKALLPEGNADLFRRILLDAEYLGIEWLLNDVMCRALDHQLQQRQWNLRKKFNLERKDSAGFQELREWPANDEAAFVEAKVWMFKHAFGDFDRCFEMGVLPHCFFRRDFDRTAWRQKVKQLIPAPEGATVVFFEDERDLAGQESRSVVCLALVETPHGQTHIQPVVRARGILKPEDDDEEEWSTNFLGEEDQLVTAHVYMGLYDGTYNVAGANSHWSYAYQGEVDEKLAGIGELELN